MKTLVVHCHPNPQSFSAALNAAACDALRQGGHDVRNIDLYAEGFDPVLKRDERLAYLDNPGLIEARVQVHVDALRWAEHLMFVYPVWIHGPPAMLKGWLERVLLPGVAFLPAKRKGDKTTPGLLHVRRLTVVTTCGAPRWWRWVVGDPNRRVFSRAIRSMCAKLCKVTWLQQHDMNTVTPADLENFLLRVRRTLGAMR